MADKTKNSRVKKLFKKSREEKEEPSSPTKEQELERVAKLEDVPEDVSAARATKDLVKVLGDPGNPNRYEQLAEGTGATGGEDILARNIAPSAQAGLLPEDQAEVDEAKEQGQAFKEAYSEDDDFDIEGVDGLAPESEMAKAVKGAAWREQPRAWTGGGGWKYEYQPAVNGDHTKHSTIKITDPAGKPRGTIDPSSEHFEPILREYRTEEGHGFGTKIDPAFAKGGAPAEEGEGGGGVSNAEAQAQNAAAVEQAASVPSVEKSSTSAGAVGEPVVTAPEAPEAPPVAEAALENAAPAPHTYTEDEPERSFGGPQSPLGQADLAAGKALSEATQPARDFLTKPYEDLGALGEAASSNAQQLAAGAKYLGYGDEEDKATFDELSAGRGERRDAARSAALQAAMGPIAGKLKEWASDPEAGASGGRLKELLAGDEQVPEAPTPESVGAKIFAEQSAPPVQAMTDDRQVESRVEGPTPSLDMLRELGPELPPEYWNAIAEEFTKLKAQGIGEEEAAEFLLDGLKTEAGQPEGYQPQDAYESALSGGAEARGRRYAARQSDAEVQ